MDCLNNWWILIICAIVFFVIVRKIYNLFQPFDEHRFLLQCMNQEKLKKKFTLNSVPDMIPSLTSYYIGI
jgi:hypothetical protein